jgi:hypothetical protein
MSTQILRNNSLRKLLRLLKRPNSRVWCALETTASFLALPFPCIPGPMKVARGREALGTRMFLLRILDAWHLREKVRQHSTESRRFFPGSPVSSHRECWQGGLGVSAEGRFPLTEKYFAWFLLNCDHPNKPVLLDRSQFKRIWAKNFDSQIFLASGNPA